MINNISLVGRIAKDPEYKKTTNDKSVCTYRLAVERDFKKGIDDVDYISCVAWGTQADLTNKYVHKGDMIGVTGRWQVRHYDDSTGKRVYINECLVLTTQFLNSNRTNTNYEKHPTPQSESYNDENVDDETNNNGVVIQDDELPF